MFPDEAVLPATSNTDLGGGGGNETVAGSSADAGSPPASGGAGTGSIDSGGGAGLAGAADAGNGGVGGVIEPSGGQGGAGGTGVATCDDPLQTVVVPTEDTWIGSAKPGTGHANDTQLFVDTGADERRMLLWIDLPAAPDGASLVRATLTFHLEANADVTLAQRRLGLHLLSESFVESRTTWTNFSNGANNKWATPGGDYGALLARATLPAGTSTGPLSFDVTEPLAMAYAATLVPLPLIIREIGVLPPAPAVLAFTSAEGDASQPSLVIEYCLP